MFDVRSYHKLLCGTFHRGFSLGGYWCAKVPIWASFFFWIEARDGILTIDNLVKRGQSLVNRCCLCCCEGETMNHLLLHYKLLMH